MATITVDLVAKTGAFSTDIKRAARDMQRTGKQMEADIKRIGTALGAIGAGAALGLGALVKQSINAADAFNDMSKRTGLSVEMLSRLQVAAKLSDTSLQALQTGVGRLAKAQTDAARGGKEQIDVFNAMGVAFKNADGSLRDTESLLLDVADVFQTLPDGAEKTALALKLLGRGGQELLPFLSEGSAGIREMNAQADALGITLSQNTTTAAAEFNDKLDLGVLAVQGLGQSITAELIGPLDALLGSLVEVTTKGDLASQVAGQIQAEISGIGSTIRQTQNDLELFSAFWDKLKATVALDSAAFDDAVARMQQAQANAADPTFGFGGVTFVDPAELLAEDRARAQDEAVAATVALTTATDRQSLSYEELRRNLAGYLTDQNAAAEAARLSAEQARDTAAAQKVLEDALAAIDKEWEDYAAILQDVYGDQAAVTEAYERQQKHFADQARDIRDEITLLGLSGDAREAMAIQIDAERLSRDANGVAIEKEGKQLVKLLTEYRKAAKLESIVSMFDNTGMGAMVSDIELVRDALDEAFDPARIERLQNALGELQQGTLLFATDALGAGISSLQSMAEEGSKAYKRLEIAQAALNLTTAIGAIANQGMGDPYTAFARIAAMIAAMNQLGLAVSGGGGASGMSAAERQQTQGTGTVLGDADAKSESILNATEITADATSELVGINRGMLRALQTLEAGLGSASGMLARGAGTVDVGPLASGTGGFLGSLPDPLGLTSMIFGGSQELIDQGIVIAGGALNSMLSSVVVGAYNTIETDGGWFSGDDIDTNITDITAQFGDQFSLIIESISNTVREGALALGLLPGQIESAMAAFQVEEIRISLMGLSAEEQQAELTAVFSSIFDGLAGSVVPFIDQFQQLGEGLGETLVRVATSVQVTQEAMLQLGFALDQTDPETFAQIAVGLIDLSGGIDGFIEGMSTFMRAFATEEHQFAVAQDEITRALAQFGLSVPPTRDAMWELMQSLDATTATGREQIATLLRLAGVSDAYYDALEDQAQEAAQAIAEAAEAAMAAEQARIDAMFEYAATVQGINRQLYELSGATDFRQSLAAIQEQYMTTTATLHAQAVAAGLTAARTEDLTAAMQLQLRQAAQLERQLTESAQAAGDALSYTPLAIINEQIAALQAEENAAAESTRNLQDSIREMGRIASDVASAMLGDMGPLSGTAKADYALRALQDGAISLDAALNAGRDVFASGADFNQFFNEAVAIAGNRREDTPQNVGQTVSLAMRDLLAQQAELEAQANQAGRTLQAQELAAMVADLSYIRGQSPEEVLASLGIDLDRFIADLGVSDAEGFDAFIGQLQTDQMAAQQWFADNVTADGLYIVDALAAIFNGGVDPLLTPIPEPEKPYGDEPFVGGEKSGRDERDEQIAMLLERVDRLTTVVERNLPNVAKSTEKVAVASKDRLQIAQRESMRREQSQRRRQESTGSGSGSKGGGGGPRRETVS